VRQSKALANISMAQFGTPQAWARDTVL
jgi:hypothetical protein